MHTSEKFKSPLNQNLVNHLNNSDKESNGIFQGNIVETDGELAILMEGDSMSPVLQHGDIVLIDKNVEVQEGDIVMAIFENETRMIKRYRQLPNFLVELYPENKFFQRTITERSKLRAIYKVVQSQREFL